MLSQYKPLSVWAYVVLGVCNFSRTSSSACDGKRFYGNCTRSEFSFYQNKTMFGTTIETIQKVIPSISSFSSICTCDDANNEIQPLECTNQYLCDEILKGLQQGKLQITDENQIISSDEKRETTSSTPRIESTEHQPGTIEEMCPCSCKYFDKIDYWSQEANQIKQYKELSQQLAYIEKILKMEKKNLTSYLNQKRSTDDKRPSVRTTGYFGAVILALILCCIVLLDIVKN